MKHQPRIVLQKLRYDARLSQAEVAIAVGISDRYYGMIERGTRCATLNVAKRIADYWEQPIEALFFADNDNKKESCVG